MAKKTDKELDAGLLRQFDSLKQKHPDAMLLFGRAISTGSTRRMLLKPP